jgi:DNA-directed RNA polymerase specialized sigma subunit
MIDLDGFVSDFIRQKGLAEHARPEILEEINARLTDMVLDNLESESALDEYAFLRDNNEDKELRAFLEAAIPDLDEREKQVLEDFRSTYGA